ncbi:hypothetical protein GUJ93_ZPchr0002g23126 [Zizania palustris]|uniref:Uncharacterized protein n=1 Tax=Zizania palustris TaxID=103762 RepID=A0A8J5RUT1_ZIZPA|nr:hypothetical protein GUJ93_ZPchr0002g23126 [Zizania palustris]
MDAYLEQAKKFDEDPEAPLPSAAADLKQEVAANPLGPLAGQLTFYIKSAIQALQAIDKICSAAASSN